MTNKQNGFTLTELITSQAVAGIFLLVLITLWSFAGTTLSGATASAEIGESLQDIRLNLASGKQCSFNFAGAPFAISNAAGVKVKSLQTFNANGNPLGVLAEIGAKKNGYTIQDMRLKPVAQTDLSFALANLEITYRKTSGFGEPLAPRRISVMVQTGNGKIQKCWVRKDLQTVASNQLCQALSRGAWNEYDPSTNRCNVTNGKWVSGTPYKVKCPSGTKLPFSANAEFNCMVKEPASFVDPNAIVTLNTSKGLVKVDASVPPYMVDISVPNNTCSCSYDVSIGSQINKFQCQILCVAL